MEFVVAAAIILIGVIAVVAVVRKSTDMQVNDNFRRQARAAILRQFETAFVRYSEDPNGYRTEFHPVDEDNNPLPVPFYVEIGDTVDVGDVVDINRGGGGTIGTPDAIKAKMIYSAANGCVNIIALGGNDEVCYHDITISVAWEDIDGTKDTVTLTKRLAAIHDR